MSFNGIKRYLFCVLEGDPTAMEDADSLVEDILIRVRDILPNGFTLAGHEITSTDPSVKLITLQNLVPPETVQVLACWRQFPER